MLKSGCYRFTTLLFDNSFWNRLAVAVKMVHEASALSEFETEARLLSGFSHPNIVKAVAVSLKSFPAFIALELMACDLLSYIADNRSALRENISVR